jgi:hypothetical protein
LESTLLALTEVVGRGDQSAADASTISALEHPADDHKLTRVGEALDELAKIDAPLSDLRFFAASNLPKLPP